jgi:hypothetical protein
LGWPGVIAAANFPIFFPLATMLSTETDLLNLILTKIKLPVQTVASRFAGLRFHSIAGRAK